MTLTLVCSACVGVSQLTGGNLTVRAIADDDVLHTNIITVQHKAVIHP